MSTPRYFPGFATCIPASLLLVGLGAMLVPTLGCRIAQAPNRIERQEIHAAKLANFPLPVHPAPRSDEAEQVIAICGQPSVDRVMPVYSKYYNGPVRRLEYVGRRSVTLDFIPSMPKAELAYAEAPLPHDGHDYGALPSNATWQFQAGYMEQEQMVTARRVAVYLPCAGEALRPEF